MRAKRGDKRKLQVPVGLEKLLFVAAGDEAFKERLLADPSAVATEAGVTLRDSESAMLSAITPAALDAMIASIVPENPRRRRFMGLVAAAAASLAAGTVSGSCGDDDSDDDDTDTGTGDTDTVDTETEGGWDGATADTDVDGDTDTDTDTNTDTVDTGTDTETASNGIGPDASVDGDFDDWFAETGGSKDRK
jgi:hypothetical protein